MILRIVLFLSCGMLVTSNNGYPIIPTQTYPIYQQNVYANPSDNQPSDIAPYLQNMMVQNKFPPLNFSPSNIREILLNRILLSQPMQTIFDQNSRSYSSNLVDVPNNEIVPNAVNNYFATPMVNEYVNNQPTGANKEEKITDNKTKRKRRKHKKRKSKRNHDTEKNQISTNQHDKTNNLQSDNTELSKKFKKRSRKPKRKDFSHENQTENIGNEINKKTKKKKRKNHAKNPGAEETNVEEHKPRRRRKNKPKPDNAEKIVSKQQIKPEPNQIQEGINLAHFYEGHVEENRVPRNPIAEGNDVFKSIPYLPENIGNTLNYKGLPQFNNHAMGNFFANYEKIYQSMMANNKVTNDQKEVIKRKPKRRNNNKTKVEVKNKNSTVTKATIKIKPTKQIASPKINVVTTEKTTHIIEKPSTNIDPIPKVEGSNSIDRPLEVKEAVHELENEEIGDLEANINDPDPNYGYIDDYYPQFTDSAAYPTANNREVFIKNLGDTKYYYAVDKGNPELINTMRFEGFEFPKRVTKDNEVNKQYDNVKQKEGKSDAFKPYAKGIKEEVIQFRSPPQLEMPDFQTRKIERNEINSQPFYDFDENEDFDQIFLGDKAIFSDAKVPYYAGTKDNSIEVKEDKSKDVETVFATSKVVNYGPGYNPDDSSTTAASIIQELTDDSYSKDGGITYVMATSYPEGQIW